MTGAMGAMHEVAFFHVQELVEGIVGKTDVRSGHNLSTVPLKISGYVCLEIGEGYSYLCLSLISR